jgi:hypothetical protein
MSGIHYVTEPTAYLEPRITKTGYGSRPAKTVIEVFQTTVQAHGNQPALCFKHAVDVRFIYFNLFFFLRESNLLSNQFQGKLPKEYQQVNYQEYWNLCMKFAKTLVHLGVDVFDITNILGFNSVSLE